MKKHILTLLLVVALVLGLTACTTYRFDDTEQSNMRICYSKVYRKCFVGPIFYHKGSTTEIVLPDEYNGFPVVSLGGACGKGVLTPFMVRFEIEDQLPEGTVVCDSTDSDIRQMDWKDAVVITENIRFEITLPAGLKEIDEGSQREYVQYARYTDENGVETVWVQRPVFSFTIADENKYFYTRDGKLYDKKTDEQIPGFLYEEYTY